MGQKSLSSFNIHTIPERMALELLSTVTIQTTTITFYSLPFLLAQLYGLQKVMHIKLLGYSYYLVRKSILSV